jgi:multidrug resistance efflux pump
VRALYLARTCHSQARDEADFVACRRRRCPATNSRRNHSVRVGNPAKIKLLGYSQVVRGRVDSIARAINVSNAQPNNQGVATVNPIFTWVRLAQRIPVRIHIDEVPPGVTLAAGMTATVEVDDGGRAVQ